ncbi:MAG: hypothetical protein HS123_04980 [Solibacteraceae bacterium]|nr:hypothetical protein [Solibacteraceae bacterium]
MFGLYVVEVDFARGAEAFGKEGVVAGVLEVKLMGQTEGFAGDLPGARGFVENENTAAGAAEDDVALVGAALPDGVADVALDCHVVVFHGADAEEEVDGNVKKISDFEDVGGDLGGLLAGEEGDRLPEANAGVGFALEANKTAQNLLLFGAGKLVETTFNRQFVGGTEDGGLFAADGEGGLVGDAPLEAGDGAEGDVVPEDVLGACGIVGKDGDDGVVGVFARIFVGEEEFDIAKADETAEVVEHEVGEDLVVEAGDFGEDVAGWRRGRGREGLRAVVVGGPKREGERSGYRNDEEAPHRDKSVISMTLNKRRRG